MHLFYLALHLEAHGLVLYTPSVGRGHDQCFYVTWNDDMARMQHSNSIHERCPLPFNVDHVAFQTGPDGVLATPAEANHPNLLSCWRRTPELLEKIHAVLVSRTFFVPRHPHDERWRISEDARVLLERRLLRCIDGNQDISNVELHGVAFEEVGEVDQVLAAFGKSIGYEFVVGQQKTEDVGVHYDDGLCIRAVADYVGVEIVNHFLFALGEAFVDSALKYNQRTVLSEA